MSLITDQFVVVYYQIKIVNQAAEKSDIVEPPSHQERIQKSKADLFCWG